MGPFRLEFAMDIRKFDGFYFNLNISFHTLTFLNNRLLKHQWFLVPLTSLHFEVCFISTLTMNTIRVIIENPELI